MKPYILGVIFARGGSKGLHGKNIKELAGKPLIAYAIETAKKVSLIDRLIVSTDSEEIADVARKYGAEIPFIRPAEFARDDSPELFAWKHSIGAVEKELGHKVDISVSVPVTSPLRSERDVTSCIELLLQGDTDIVVTAKVAERNPYFNMITLDEKGYAKLAIPTGKDISRRQQAPVVYDMTTVAYAAVASYILKASSLLEGRVKVVEIPSERAIDIDTMLDFEIAECLINKRGRK